MSALITNSKKKSGKGEGNELDNVEMGKERERVETVKVKLTAVGEVRSKNLR